MSSFPGLELSPKDDYFTFSFLKDAPTHSIEGGVYLGETATKTFEGAAWQVMKENGLVYDFNAGIIKQIATITQRFQISIGVNYFLSNGLILPGSLNDEGKRVTDYSAHYSFDTKKFKYSEVTFV